MQLTARQVQVLQLVAKGLTNRQIGKAIGCAQRTVDKHMEMMYYKFNIPGNRILICRRAYELGIVRLENMNVEMVEAISAKEDMEETDS